MRIGIGYDIHRLQEGRNLVLGGVKIPFLKGLAGHSDADVLLHALCDGLLGALGEGDIGQHFPANDLSYKDISSLKLLTKVMELVIQKGYTVSNVDAIVLAEEPNIEPFKKDMKAEISDVLHMSLDEVNIKATTAEGIGSIGTGEAIAAYAVVLLEGKPVLLP